MSRFDKKPTSDLGYVNRVAELARSYENKNTIKDIYSLPLAEICPRSENKYINKVETHRELKKSIESIGLQQPIIVVPISEYEPQSDEEREYLQKMETEYGCKYFISSGERRFRAMVGIATGKDILDRDDLIEFYNYCKENNPYKKFDSYDIESRDISDQWKWYIDCNVVKNRIENESTIYNDTNLTSRAITKFEIIANSYDEMIKKGVEIKYNADIQKYILDNKGIDIDLGTLKILMRIVRDGSSQLKQFIYEGKVSSKDAIKLMMVFEKRPDLTAEIMEEIGNGTFNIKKYNDITKRERKATNIKKKGKHWNDKEVITLLKQIKEKEISVDDAISWIENQISAK